jgi:hypothetical protein
MVRKLALWGMFLGTGIVAAPERFAIALVVVIFVAIIHWSVDNVAPSLERIAPTNSLGNANSLDDLYERQRDNRIARAAAFWRPFLLRLLQFSYFQYTL